MVQASRHTGTPDSALVRLLARMAGSDVRESPQGFADRLGLWLRWTDAMPLFTALKDAPAPRPASGDPAKAAAAVQTIAGAAARLRSALVRAIAEETAAATVEFRAPPVPLPGEVKEATPGFPPYRRCVLARQSAMAAAIAPLRGRLRMALSARSPALARLATVDTVLEQVIGNQEHRLLAGIPKVLEKRFRQLRDASGEDAVADWPTVFQHEVQSVLLAELDLRWQPIEGLMKTLRSNL
nr:DUF3348 family protein [Variovorax boronicumulans]